MQDIWYPAGYLIIDLVLGRLFGQISVILSNTKTGYPVNLISGHVPFSLKGSITCMCRLTSPKSSCSMTSRSSCSEMADMKLVDDTERDIVASEPSCNINVWFTKVKRRPVIPKIVCTPVRNICMFDENTLLNYYLSESEVSAHLLN